MHTDALDLPLSGGSVRAVALYDTALRQFQCLRGDPLATLAEAVAEAPGLLMGHVLSAWLCLVSTDHAALAPARAALDRADALAAGATARERAHLHAARLWADGHWREAATALEDVAIAHPRDALALQVGHVLDFYRGDARMLRDRIARALPAWSESMPGYHALLGMHAFGLEETGDYAQAEISGRHAVALQRHDGWAWHAVAHVFEMQDRIEDGIAWLQSDPDAWADGGLAVHNWWHLALFQLERGDEAAVLALFDGPVFGGGREASLDLVDASALLWRLRLRGIDVGDRWQRVADAWAAQPPGWYAFNDTHAAMAFVAAGRAEALEALLDDHDAAARGEGDNARYTAEVGVPLLHALVALTEGDHRRAARCLRHVRPLAQRFGGSHAQRDLIDLSLIEAALQGGDRALAQALVAERAVLKPTRRSTQEFLRRVGATAARRAA